MARAEPDNCVQVVGNEVLVDGVVVALLVTETSPSHLLDAFRRSIDTHAFSRAVHKERDAHYFRERTRPEPTKARR